MKNIGILRCTSFPISSLFLYGPLLYLLCGKIYGPPESNAERLAAFLT